jgi:HTH-type transcriptional regulator/antitoxin HigA
MSTARLTTYESLLLEFRPRPIQTEAAYNKALRQVERLMKPHLPRAESEILHLLSTLIAQYEAQHYPAPEVSPREMLAHVLEERGITPAALSRDTGIPETAIREMCAGVREITPASAITLGRYFGLPADLFLAAKAP